MFKLATPSLTSKSCEESQIALILPVAPDSVIMSVSFLSPLRVRVFLHDKLTVLGKLDVPPDNELLDDPSAPLPPLPLLPLLPPPQADVKAATITKLSKFNLFMMYSLSLSSLMGIYSHFLKYSNNYLGSV